MRVDPNAFWSWRHLKAPNQSEYCNVETNQQFKDAAVGCCEGSGIITSGVIGNSFLIASNSAEEEFLILFDFLHLFMFSTALEIDWICVETDERHSNLIDMFRVSLNITKCPFLM